MRSTVARGVKGLAQGTQSLISQVVVSVATALAVAFITGATLGGGEEAAKQPGPAAELAAAPAPSAADAAAGPQPLPPLEVEIVADVPNGPVAGPEIFPGVPAGMPATTLRATAAVAERPSEPARRRFLGIPLPFGGEDAVPASAAAIDTAVRGG